MRALIYLSEGRFDTQYFGTRGDGAVGLNR